MDCVFAEERCYRFLAVFFFAAGLAAFAVFFAMGFPLVG